MTRALQTAGDCAEHGSELQRLEKLLHEADQREPLAEAGRVALVNGVHAINTYVEGLSQRGEVGEVRKTLQKLLDRTHNAHQRAWHGSRPKARAAATPTQADLFDLADQQ